MRELMTFAVSILGVCVLLAGQEVKKIRRWELTEEENGEETAF